MDKRPIEKPFDDIDAPIPDFYGAIDTDLARDNLENDLPFIDARDLKRTDEYDEFDFTHAKPGMNGEDF